MFRALASGFETSELEQSERKQRHKARVKNIRPPFWDAGILGDTGTISRVGRKSATKVIAVFKHGMNNFVAPCLPARLTVPGSPRMDAGCSNATILGA